MHFGDKLGRNQPVKLKPVDEQTSFLHLEIQLNMPTSQYSKSASHTHTHTFSVIFLFFDLILHMPQNSCSNTFLLQFSCFFIQSVIFELQLFLYLTCHTFYFIGTHPNSFLYQSKCPIEHTLTFLQSASKFRREEKTFKSSILLILREVASCIVPRSHYTYRYQAQWLTYKLQR